MDEVLFGSVAEGDQVYRLCVGFLEKILLAAKDCYPGQAIKATFDAQDDALLIFVEPVIPVGEDSTTPPMILVELTGTNYVDGEPHYQVHLGKTMEERRKAVAKPAKDAGESKEEPPQEPPSIPQWEVGYTIEQHDGTGPVTAATIRSRFNTTRKRQMMFDTLLLPTGVTAHDLEAAVARVEANSGATLDPTDLTLRFPATAGMTYLAKLPASVKILRRLARKGAAQLIKEEREAVKEAAGQQRTFVQGTTEYTVKPM